MLKVVDCKEKYRVEVWDEFPAWEEEDINSAWETIRENIKITAKDTLRYCELRKYNSLYHEGCSELVGQWKEPEMQWLQDPSEGISTLHDVKPADVPGIKKREYLEEEINELATNSKNKNTKDLYKEIDAFRRTTHLEIT
jgi:hypothetical protein